MNERNHGIAGAPLAWEIVGAVAGGVLLGWLGAKVVFVGSFLSLVPWGLASIAIGVAVSRRRRATAVAAIFGFALAASFMAIGYAGADPIASKIGFFCVLGIVGAFCAACLALAANIVAHRASSRRRPGSPGSNR
jgi:uncharacterized membrane protein YeaQ/YmgE (transglycosylase-associated protein family)